MARSYANAAWCVNVADCFRHRVLHVAPNSSVCTLDGWEGELGALEVTARRRGACIWSTAMQCAWAKGVGGVPADEITTGCGVGRGELSEDS
jgi:hypothetical protein